MHTQEPFQTVFNWPTLDAGTMGSRVFQHIYTIHTYMHMYIYTMAIGILIIFEILYCFEIDITIVSHPNRTIQNSNADLVANRRTWKGMLHSDGLYGCTLPSMIGGTLLHFTFITSFSPKSTLHITGQFHCRRK